MKPNNEAVLREALTEIKFCCAVPARQAMRAIAERALAATATVAKDGGEVPAIECGACHGSGWVVRDEEIGTDQECFSCGGSGVDDDATSRPSKNESDIDLDHLANLAAEAAMRDKPEASAEQSAGEASALATIDWCARTVRAIADLGRHAPLGDWYPQAVIVAGALKNLATPISEDARPVPATGSIGDDAEFKRHQLRVAIAISESTRSEEYAPCVKAWADLVTFLDTRAAASRNSGVVADSWRAAVQRFVDRVDAGEVRSKVTYAEFKALLATTAPDTSVREADSSSAAPGNNRRLVPSSDAALAAPSPTGESLPDAWMKADTKECISAGSKQWMERAGFGVWDQVAARYTRPLFFATPTVPGEPT